MAGISPAISPQVWNLSRIASVIEETVDGFFESADQAS
jgi:hypothetical protein